MKTLCALITYVLVEAVFARQSLPLSGAVLPVGRLNVVTRSLVPPAAPLRVRQNAAFLAAASGSPPGRLKPPCPSRGLACRCVPPRQLGRAVGLKACISCAVWAKPSALFVLSGCSSHLRWIPPHPLKRIQPCHWGGFPRPPTSYYYDDFTFLFT